jgi:hypothetical protein
MNSGNLNNWASNHPEYEVSIRESIEWMSAAQEIMDSEAWNSPGGQGSHLDRICKVKELIDRAMKDLYPLRERLTMNSDDFAQFDRFLSTQQVKHSDIKNSLLQMIANTKGGFGCRKKTSSDPLTLHKLLLELKLKENEFYHNFEQKESSKFVVLSKTYFDISEFMSAHLRDYLTCQSAENGRNMKYLKIVNEIELDTASFEKFESLIETSLHASLAYIGDAFTRILDDYYQDQSGAPCLSIITRTLKACARKGKFDKLSTKLDEEIVNLVQPGFKVSKIVDGFSKFFQSNNDKKNTLKIFLDIFKNFSKILIELEIDKPDKTISEAEYYQFAYFFIFFKMSLKIFLIIALQASQKQISAFDRSPIML